MDDVLLYEERALSRPPLVAPHKLVCLSGLESSPHEPDILTGVATVDFDHVAGRRGVDLFVGL